MFPRSFIVLLVLCCAVVVTRSSRVTPPHPPKCNAMLAFSSQPPIQLSAGTGTINSRSVLPWRWRSTTVKNRIPSTLWEAQCSGSSSPGPGQTLVQDLTLVPIYQNILVLTRQNSSHCYTASFQSVAVGCTSVRATTSYN